MADTITASKVLNIGLEYDENGTKKTATIKIPNYKSELTEQQIKAAFNENILIYGYDADENPLPITSDNVLTASTTNQSVNNVDIGWED